jgi:hypothetical protein
MDKKYYLFIINMLLIIASCTDKSVNDPSDQQLNVDIIGNWKTINDSAYIYSISFYSDGTFIDTNIYNAGYYDLPVNRDSSGMTVRKGKYSVANNVLSFNEFYITKYAQGTFNPIGYYPIDYEIVIENNTLERKPLYRLKAIGTTSDIYGSWRMDGWFCIYNNETSANQYGIYSETYTFTKDSVKHNGYNTIFKYDPPYLTIGYGPETPYDPIKVEFHNSIMYWYYYKWKEPILINTKKYY